MFNGKIHYKWPCSIAFCMFTRGSYSVSFNNSDHGQRARSEQGDLQLLPSPAVELGLHGESLDRLMDGFLDEWIYGVYIITYYMQYIYIYVYICADYSAIGNIYLFVLNVHVWVDFMHGGRVPPKIWWSLRPDFPHWNCHDLGVLTIFKQSYICLTLQWHNHDGN